MHKDASFYRDRHQDTDFFQMLKKLSEHEYFLTAPTISDRSIPVVALVGVTTDLVAMLSDFVDGF